VDVGKITGGRFLTIRAAFQPANKPVAIFPIYPSTPVICPAKRRVVRVLYCSVGLSSTGELINVIVAIDGQLITEKSKEKPKVSNGYAVSDVDRDILKIVVVNRYKKAKPSVAFIKNFGLKEGAIASSVAHDSHNIIAVGVSDEDICRAVNLIVKNKGGISAVSKHEEDILPLPIAGIISDKEYGWVAKKYTNMKKKAKMLGSKLKAPYMTLSFMALPVIPRLKLSDKGLFDSEKNRFIDLFENA